MLKDTEKIEKDFRDKILDEINKMLKKAKKFNDHFNSRLKDDKLNKKALRKLSHKIKEVKEKL
jgi:hypothetical protein